MYTYMYVYIYICYVHTHTHKFLSTWAHMHVPRSIHYHYQYHTHTLTYIHTDACMHCVTIYAQFYIPSTEVMLECHSHSKGEGTDSLIFLKKKSVTTGSAAIVCVLINGNAKQIKNVK